MALYVCNACGTKFAVGSHRCPQCTAESAYLLDDAAEAEVLAGGPLPGAELVPDPDPEDGPDDTPASGDGSAGTRSGRGKPAKAASRR